MGAEMNQDEGIIPPHPPMDLEASSEGIRDAVNEFTKWLYADISEYADHTSMCVLACKDIAHPEALPALLEALQAFERECGSWEEYKRCTYSNAVLTAFEAIGYKGQA